MRPRPNHPLQNKKTICYCELHTYSVKVTLNTTSNTFQRLLIHAVKRPALSCPLMRLEDQHFCAHFKTYKLLTNNQNLINNKDSIHSLNSSIKSTNIENNLHKQQNKVNTPKNHHIPLPAQIHSCIKEQIS
jgi:hypothetical protein